jgi:serine/threonine protein kinase
MITNNLQRNIVQAIDVASGLGRQSTWLILEWIEHDLSSISIDKRDIVTLLENISAGLKYMHPEGYAHRDVKPSNVLVRLKNDRLDVAEIADFGTTKYDITGAMRSRTGTSLYLAPEVWGGEYTNAVDVWSLGVLAAEYISDWKPPPREVPGNVAESEGETEFATEIADEMSAEAKIVPGMYTSVSEQDHCIAQNSGGERRRRLYVTAKRTLTHRAQGQMDRQGRRKMVRRE